MVGPHLSGFWWTVSRRSVGGAWADTRSFPNLKCDDWSRDRVAYEVELRAALGSSSRIVPRGSTSTRLPLSTIAPYHATVLVVVASPELDRHFNPGAHPERPERAIAALAGLGDAGLTEAVVRVPPRPATREELARVHDPALVDFIHEVSAAGGGRIDEDTRASAGSYDTALLAAGAGLAAIDALDHGLGGSAFVAVRPPGHHATATQAMGFCLFNNVAVTAAALVDRGERVCVIDWDVHHGNGTQDIFYDDDRVLFASTHEWPLYPGTGAVTETGGERAPGLTINVPLPAGTTGDALLAAIDHVIAPAVDEFAPTWLLVSAGFDAHRDDPLANLQLTAGDFADLTRRVRQLVPASGRTIVFLEGGYDLRALRDSVGATVAALADTEYRPEDASSGGEGMTAVENARQVHAQFR
jgi:acetoin utilization deacetylase AcuC-like enzyme